MYKILGKNNEEIQHTMIFQCGMKHVEFQKHISGMLEK